MKNFVKKNYNYIIVFLIPWILIMIHSFTRMSWLTGQGSLLNGDTGSQIYPLMVEFWDKVHSGESIFFSWNAGNGIDFYLNFVYYLISPLNLIILILPKAWIENSLQFVMVLKWALMGVSVTYYFMNTKYNKQQVHKKLMASLMGIIFVLSEAVLTVIGYFNWGDVMIVFPFVLLALEKLIENGKWKQYYVLLTFSMICNFYMSYQICIFMVLWFFVRLSKDTTNKLRKFLIFVGSSVLAALSSCVVLLPAVFGAAGRIGGRKTDVFINNLYSIGEKIFMFSDGLVDWESYKPNLYFSTGMLVCFFLFFFIKMNKSEKRRLIVVWLFMFVSLFSGVLTKFWHGLSMPYGVYHRYLYMYIFLMLYMVMLVLQNLDSLKKWQVAAATVVELAFMIISFLHISQFGNFAGYLITFLLIVLYNLLLFFYLKGSIQYKNILVILFVIAFLEVGSNSFYQLKEYNDNNWKDILYNEEAEKLSQYVDMNLGERASFSDSPLNMGFVTNLASPNQFTSYKFDNMIDLYSNLGMEFDSSSCMAEGTSPLLNLMLNIRYGISSWEGDFSDTELVQQTDNLNLYRIDRLAGLGYMVNKNAANWNVDDNANFDAQNDFIKNAVKGEEIFTTVLPEENFTDGVLKYKHDEERYKKGYYYYDYISKTIADTEMTEFSFTVDEDMDLYMDLFSQQPMINVIYIDEKAVCRDRSLVVQGYYHIGNVKKGQQVIIYSIHSMGVGEEAALWFRFAKFNEENYAKAYENLSKNVYQIDRMDSAYVSGTIHADEDGIMMTSIPAMDGFTVYVDGKETEFDKIGDAFIGVPVKAGDHKVEFKYMTPYFKQGLIASLTGILIFAMICVMDYRKNKKKENTEEMKTVIEG